MGEILGKPHDEIYRMQLTENGEERHFYMKSAERWEA
jgi:hypothetical protein